MPTCPYRVAVAVEQDLPPVIVDVSSEEEREEIDELAPLIGAPRFSVHEAQEGSARFVATIPLVALAVGIIGVGLVLLFAP